MNRTGAAAAALACLLAAVVVAQDKGGGDETGPYDLVAGWPQNYCGAGHIIGSTAGIWAESPDRVYIFNRGCLPELKDERRRRRPTISFRSATRRATTCRRRTRPAIRAGTTSSTSSIATAS